MFKKLLALIAVLCLGATASAARVEVDESSINFDAGSTLLSFELVLTDLTGLNDTGDWLQDNVIGFDIGIKMTDEAGNNHGSIFMSNTLMQKLTGTWQIETVGDYMFAGFGAGGAGNVLTTSNVVDDGGVNLLTHGVLDENKTIETLPGFPPVEVTLGFTGVKPQLGQVVAKFIVYYNPAAPIDETNVLYVDITAGSAGNADPFFLTNAEGGGPILLEAVDFTIPVPEPATMGLLGLGLVGLVTRRKK